MRLARCARPTSRSRADRRDSTRRRAGLDWLAAALVALACLADRSPAHAQAAPAAGSDRIPGVHGAVDGRGLIGTDGRYGGALSVDLWWGSGLVRAGLAAGLGALSKHDSQSSRVFTPVGLSMALGPRSDLASGPIGTLRLGALPGAQKGGFLIDGWFSCALGYRLALGEGASIRLGADAWILVGSRGGYLFGPFLGLGF